MKPSNDAILISPSIIAADLSMMGELASSLDPASIDLLHIDVMDGRFVPNLTIGPGYIKALGSHTSIPLDVHLMIERPEDSIDSYIECKPWCITIHYESTRFPSRLLSAIRGAGIRAGMALNPATPVESVFDLCEYLDLALVMAVDPGFYGQAFMKAALGRIERTRGFLRQNGLEDKLALQVDGGISRDTISGVVRAGARIIVAGSAVFGKGDPSSNARELKEAARTAIQRS